MFQPSLVESNFPNYISEKILCEVFVPFRCVQDQRQKNHRLILKLFPYYKIRHAIIFLISISVRISTQRYHHLQR